MNHIKKPRICFIVPAYNEEASIRSVVSELRLRRKNDHVVVINDGSTDETSAQVRDLDITLIELPFNLGIGGSVQTGLKYARDHDFDVAVQIDADGQHTPSEVEKLLAAINNDVDMVIGSRFIKKTSYTPSCSRNIGIQIFSFLLFLTIGKKFYDPTSGFRAFNKKAISFLSDHYPTDFPEPESIIYLDKAGLKIKEVSVKMSQRQGGVSSVTQVKAVYLMIAISLGILVNSLRRRSTYELRS
jgi:glycosyltransferase involved in cell wall biosynthesis